MITLVEGGIVFTLIVIVTVAVVLYRTLRCKHAWELVDKSELPSGFENMQKAGVTSGAMWPSDYPKMASKTIILALRCPKCGAAKIHKELAP